ncbi:MAG: hypothetical protein OZSIB_3503 [Candidatus Ozemobacter sibiricus]|jgi:hypothetical protein|uniref:Uncharacterized protein n=1 Tax=Candidatus Ozemobacter sibiricus TaxID=2268124 RepID=A0A367ZSK0_9BACT|nr:MAG: hypothetical protein OZSIB_3503 [Candidatus Ozemobacter sibiricus]
MKKLLVMACVVAGVWLSGLAPGGQAVAAEPETTTLPPTLLPTEIPAPQPFIDELLEERARKKANLARLERIADDLRALRQAPKPDVAYINHALATAETLDTWLDSEKDLIKNLVKALTQMKFLALQNEANEREYQFHFQDAVRYTMAISQLYSKWGVKI